MTKIVRAAVLHTRGKMVEQAEIRVVHRGGSRINFRVPLISNDSKFIVCAAGECIKVFSISTEECIHDMQGHTDRVTGIIHNPSNELQVYSCSEDGTIRLWDFTDGILIKTFLIHYPVYSVYGAAEHAGVLFINIPMASDGAGEMFQLVAFHLPRCADQVVEALDMSAVLCNISCNPGSTAIGRGGEYIANAKGLQLEIYFFKKQESNKIFLSKSTQKGAKNDITCISCHPTDDCIATGHADGKIRLWRNFNHKKDYTSSILHWHHTAVNALRFTPEGTNLLSGGLESVLVQWRYKQENQKDFLPRLGGAITHIQVSPDGSLFCTSHSDNKITIIQSCVKVSAIIQGLAKSDSVQVDLMIDPRSKALVLNGKPGHLQFYSLQRDQLLYNLDIVQQEYIDEAGLNQYEVVNAAFDTKGKWLATVEERKQKESEVEVNLKLWMYDEQTQSLVLNTTVSAPHEHRIKAMCFRPAAEAGAAMLVTASQDCRFKAWVLADQSDNRDEAESWSCDYVGNYHTLEPRCCCFSADGSLLAVSFQEVITVWSPASWDLLTTLSQPPGAILDLCFGRFSCSKYLLGTTAKNQLCCWNLLTCSLEWSTSMDVTRLLPDPLSDNMAAFCCHDGVSSLFVFRPSEPRPVFFHRALGAGKVRHAVFAPREEMLDGCEESSQWLNRSQLYFLTQHQDLMTFLTKAEEERLMAPASQLVIDDSVAATPFHLLLGKHRQRGQQEERAPVPERSQPPQGSIAIKELLHTPAHVLPSASFLCSMFVRSLLISNGESTKRKEAPGEEMESEKEEEDSEEEMEQNAGRQEVSSKRGPAEESTTLALTKAQERELRRVKKLDLSWLSTLIDS